MTYSFTSPKTFVTFDAASKSVSVEVPASQRSQASIQIVQMIAKANTTLVQISQPLQIQLIDCTPSNLSANPPLLTISRLGSSVFTLLSKSPPNDSCATYQYDLSPIPLPTFISRTGNMITLAPTISHEIGSYEFTVKESNILAPLISSLITLKVQITKCVLLSLTTTEILKTSLFFISGGPAIPFTTPSFNQTPAC